MNRQNPTDLNLTKIDDSFTKIKDTLELKWKGGAFTKTAIIFVVFLFLPFVLLILTREIYKRNETNPTLAKILSGLFILMVFLPLSTAWTSGLISAIKGDKPKPKQQVSQQTPVVKTKSEPTTIITSKILTVDEKIGVIVTKDFSGGSTHDFTADTGLVTVTYGKGEMFLNEQKIVEGMIAVLVKGGSSLFNQVGEVKSIRIVVENELTDSYGKSSTETVARVQMSRDEFAKYEWKNLTFQPIYYQLLRSTDDLYIHPALLKKIDLDKIKLYP